MGEGVVTGRRGQGILGPVLVLALAAGPGHSEEVAWQRVTGAEARGLGGVAALFVGKVRSCSALVVAPDLALTAAHCVEGRDPAAIRLAPGGGAARLPVVAMALPEGRLPTAQVERPADLIGDLALLRLAPPAEGALPLPIPAWPNPVGEFVDILGYPRDGSEALQARTGCTVLAEAMGVVTLGCDVVSGVSGAGVFRQLPSGAAPELVAMVVAGSPGRAYALVIGGRLEALQAQLPAR